MAARGPGLIRVPAADMSPTRRNLLAASLGLPAVAAHGAAAAARSDGATLRIIYNRTAQYHLPDRNPIIVIPGILGTRLVDSASRETVWGAFDGIALRSLSGPSLRRLALPIDGPVVPAGGSEPLKTEGVLEKVRVRLLGIPFELRQYAQIMATLGAGGYRDETLGLNGIDYGAEHFTCFQFPYDWRRDNAESAGLLKRFMDAKRIFVADQYRRRFGLQVAPETIKFDVVAHSMGALLFRYFLRYGDQALPNSGAAPTIDWSGAGYVDRAILVAPPNAGSAVSLRFLVEGEDFGRPVAPFYPPALLGSYPSIYQLLPRRGLENGDGAVDVLDSAHWSERRWGLGADDQAPLLEQLLPDVADPVRRRELALSHQARLLRRARQFQGALDRPALAPAGLETFAVVSDGEPTVRAYRLERGARRLQAIDNLPGDGTVTRASALFDQRTEGDWTPHLRSPLSFRGVLFTGGDHLGLTRSQVFNDNVLYWLLEDPRSADIRYAI